MTDAPDRAAARPRAGSGRRPAPLGIPVSRFDITEFVGDVFGTGPTHPDRLVRVARRRGARPAVVLVLRRLPNQPYRGLGDLWPQLADLSDVYDPWEDCP